MTFSMFCRLDDPRFHCQIKPGVCADLGPLSLLFSFGWRIKQDSTVPRSGFETGSHSVTTVPCTQNPLN